MTVSNDIRSVINETIISSHYFILLKEAEGFLYINDKMYKLHDDYVVILNPLDFFKIPEETKLTGTCIKYANIELLAVKYDFINRSSGVYKNTSYEFLTHLMSTYIDMVTNIDVSKSFLLSLAIVKIQNELNKPKVTQIFAYDYSKQIKLVRKFILNNLNLIHKTVWISKQLKIPYSRLDSLFLKTYGMTATKVCRYIKTIAVNELVINGMYFREASRSVGFTAYGTFLSYYKKIYKCKPSEYMLDSIKMNYQQPQISNEIVKYL